MAYREVVQATEERISGASNFAALRAISAAYQQGIVVVEGGSSAGDGLGGAFWFDSASTLADDGQDTIKPTSNPSAGRWRRVSEDGRYALQSDAALFSVDTIAALKASSVAGFVGGEVRIVNGYYAYGDGGGGPLRYNISSTTPDDGGMNHAPNSGPGRWERITNA